MKKVGDETVVIDIQLNTLNYLENDNNPINTALLSYGMSGEVFHAPLLMAIPDLIYHLWFSGNLIQHISIILPSK